MTAVSTAIEALEVELKQQKLWSQAAPDARAMASEMPFSHDTMSLDNWLQWILIPRMRALLDAGAPLPGECDVASYAEVVFGGPRYANLIGKIKALDDSINAAAPD